MFDFLPARDPGTTALEALLVVLKTNSESEPVIGPGPDSLPDDLLDPNLIDPNLIADANDPLADPVPAPSPPPAPHAAPHLERPRPAAGYTYLGQFVDHDITFDPTSRLKHDNDPRALTNFRTPRLDLDSLYGSGPQDQPYLYDWHDPHRGVKLLVGHNPQDGYEPEERPAEIDLPRNQQGRALIGDARNDENLIVSQLHLVFIHFHNKVVDLICEEEHPHPTGTALFEEARRRVRWHYQWVVVHDVLEQFVGPSMAREVYCDGPVGAPPTIQRRFFRWRDEPFVPVEFSGAAYRFGHSMVRDTYTVNSTTKAPILRIDGATTHLAGFRRLPAALVIEWEHFFATKSDPKPQTRLAIDASLTRALSHLPPHGASLARLNLQRGRALGLPAGADVAHAMGYPPLEPVDLGLDELAMIEDVSRRALLRATPLWYYVLCEAFATTGGVHLGPVGGRIVAEVLVGLLEADPQSYLRQWPSWRPTLGTKAGEFDMADLVRLATGVEDPPPEPAP
jgi:hypothetical protein